MVITLKMRIHPVQEASQRLNRIAPPSALLIRPMHLASAFLLRQPTASDFTMLHIWQFQQFKHWTTDFVLLLTLYRPKCLYISWALGCVPLDLWAASQSAYTGILLLLYSVYCVLMYCCFVWPNVVKVESRHAVASVWISH